MLVACNFGHLDVAAFVGLAVAGLAGWFLNSRCVRLFQLDWFGDGEMVV